MDLRWSPSFHLSSEEKKKQKKKKKKRPPWLYERERLLLLPQVHTRYRYMVYVPTGYVKKWVGFGNNYIVSYLTLPYLLLYMYVVRCMHQGRQVVVSSANT